MKLLVTGGCGFIGSHFIRVVLAERPEWEIVNLDALTYAGNLTTTMDVQTHPRYRFVYGSITNKELVERLVKEVDAVVNFAAETHVDRSIVDVEPFILTNILGTQRLVDACRQFNKRFHQVSTDEVFGSLGPNDARSTEATPYDPRNPYTDSRDFLSAGNGLYKFFQYREKLLSVFGSINNNQPRFLPF